MCSKTGNKKSYSCRNLVLKKDFWNFNEQFYEVKSYKCRICFEDRFLGTFVKNVVKNLLGPWL